MKDRIVIRKGVLFLVFIILCIILFYPYKRVITVAQTSIMDNSDEQLEETIRDQIGKLDLEELEKYMQSLSGFTNETVGERLLSYIKGSNFDYQDFGRDLLLVLFSKVTQLTPSFACIMAIALLSGLLSMLKGGGTGDSSSEMLFLILYAAALIPLIGILLECFSLVWGGVRSMHKQMGLIFPLMLTLMSASGGVISVAVCKPAVAFFSTTISSMLYEVVFPFTLLIIALTIASNFTKELKIDKFSAFFKSANKWIIGISVSIFGLFFSLQGITAASYDGVVRRAAKYAIGNGVPIIGGFLSGGFDLVVAGGILVKNAVGSLGIFLMIAVIFEPLVLLISVNVLLRLTSAITQPLGDGRISKVLGDTADNLHYCTACLLFTAFLYFLSIMLMIYCTEGLF